MAGSGYHDPSLQPPPTTPQHPEIVVILSRLTTAVAALVLLGSTVLAAPADITLRPGDKAPALENVDWLQGTAVSSFEKGHIYVLDFWATWCGPCVRSIPHVNELANTRKKDGLTVIGLAIWPSKTMTPTQEFVDDQGDKMGYTIAADIDGATAKAYMEASGSNGIPTAMVIDREGTIAWIGHPMAGMDEVIDAVIDGSFDAAAEAEKRAAEEALQKKASGFNVAIREALESDDWAAAYENATALTALDEMFAGYHSLRYRAQVHLDETGKRSAALGLELVTGVYADDANQLNGFAWWIVAPDSDVPEGRADLELAMMATGRANELTDGADVSILDTLARVTFLRGDVAGAVALQEDVIAHVEADEDLPNREPMLEQFRATLEEYQAALEG
jgi:thiol-disulfide isomerase/thioredoxin